VLVAAVVFSPFAAAQTAPLPYRFLLVISDQWKDPASYVIEDGGEFQILAALMRSWGLPFEILRLDQQRLDKYHLLDRDGRPRYGTIIWDADAASLKDKGTELVGNLVRGHGVGLVILGDSVAAPEISRLAGLQYASEYKSQEPLVFVRDHFIGRGLAGRQNEFPAGAGIPGSKVTADGATVIAARGSVPLLTVRESDKSGRVAWLGAHRPSTQIQRQLIRDLLKRSLVWVQGYALYREYPHCLILFMDDMGTSDKSFLPYWHYRTPTEEEIRTGLIEPLKRRNAALVQNVNTGFVDRKTGRILIPWQQRVVDAIDPNTVHDYASTKRGLDAGVREGVFEIQSHGWTHMLPDLDSPPGPWWNAPMDGVGSLDWYNEFGDRLRKQEIPAATQRFHMQRAMAGIRSDFGVTPLALRPGGSLFSQSYSNHTARLAAQAGFGLASGEWACYLAPDLVVSLAHAAPFSRWAFDRRLRAADIPWTIDAPAWVGFHDRDLAMDAGSVERLLNDLGGGLHYMTAGEYCAYLHAKVERDPAPPADGLPPVPALIVDYDEHYCRYFVSHASSWILHLSDETRRALKDSVPDKRTVELAKGAGRHRVSFAPR